jgi:hypothetical protein
VQDFEGLGVFYLGRTVDPATGETSATPLLYDSADLVTHGLCVGMTGSGKTGLAIGLIEEAALDGVPVIAIDPKGDLGNLLLTFPGLTAAEFEPWVNADDAARVDQSTADFAAAEATRWRGGLAAWGQDAARIERLRASAEFTLYTPGSTAGVPVSVLSSFAQPGSDDPELRTERAQTVVSGLLGLAGIDADPVKSREHILLSLLLLHAWEAGESPDLATLIARVQQPPLQRIGVMELDAFFPARERFSFALALNSLIAAPGFAVWTQGEPLDIGAMLRRADGHPRVSIFSLAHLDDAQRMFFVALLLSAVAGWMRGQSGTSSLRALVYMDEIFGFFPPVANPPSKLPLLTLLKQGRAFGLGVMLATQNPVDLDYKGLANIGTWWLGRLQTERDKARLLDGLDSASGGVDRAAVERLLSGLRKRCFLMRNVHDKELALLEARWVMSYLRGPLSREDIRRLTGQKGSVASGIGASPVNPPATAKTIPNVPALAPIGASTSAPPMLPPEVTQFFAPAPDGAALEPVVYANVELRYSDTKLKLEVTHLASYMAPLHDGPVPLEWEDAERTPLQPQALRIQPPTGATFAKLPSLAARKASYDKWCTALTRWLKANEALELLYSPSTKQTSRPDESERDFRARLQQIGREHRDDELAALRQRYAPKAATLEERLRRARQAVEREEAEVRDRGFETAISVGTTVLGAILGGRRKLTKTTLGRAGTAARRAGRVAKETSDVRRAEETVAALEQQLADLQEDFAAAAAELPSPADALAEPLQRALLLPKRGDVTVKLLTLLWVPSAAR